MKKPTTSNSNTVEIGVFLLTEDERFKNLGCSGEVNTPHVSIFQFVIHNKFLNNFIKDLEGCFLKKTSGILLLPLTTEKFHENTILKFKIKNSFYKKYFFEFKKSVIKTSKKYFLNDVYLSQIDFEKISPQECALVRRYGLYWGVSLKDFYKIHMTLKYKEYDKSLCRTFKNGKYVCFSKIGVGFLGYHGNVTKIIKYIDF